MRHEITYRIPDGATAESIADFVAGEVVDANPGGEPVNLVVRIDDSDIKVRSGRTREQITTQLTDLSVEVLTRAKLIDSGAGVDVVRTGTTRRVAAKLVVTEPVVRTR